MPGPQEVMGIKEAFLLFKSAEPIITLKSAVLARIYPQKSRLDDLSVFTDEIELPCELGSSSFHIMWNFDCFDNSMKNIKWYTEYAFDNISHITAELELQPIMLYSQILQHLAE